MVFGRATLLGGGRIEHHFVVAAAVAGGEKRFQGAAFAVSELLVKRLPSLAVMDFHYRKALVREFFSCAARRFVAKSIFVKSKQIYF